MTNEVEVYRNKFIEPYDMLQQKVEEIRALSENEMIIEDDDKKEISSALTKQDPLQHITKEQRLEVLDRVLEDLNLREFEAKERLNFLENKMLEEVLQNKEAEEIAAIGNFLNKTEQRRKNIEKAKDIAEAGGKTGIGPRGY